MSRGDVVTRSNDPTIGGTVNATQLQGKGISATAPADGDLLVYDGASWKLSGSNSSGDLIMLTTLAGVAAAVIWGALANSVSLSQAQDGSAAGAVMSIRAQRGFAGFVGGDLLLGGGDGGTLATNAPGNTRINLGTPVANLSGSLQLETQAGAVIGKLYQTAGSRLSLETGASATGGLSLSCAAGALSLTAATSNLSVQAATFIQLEAAGGVQEWITTTNCQWYMNGALARLDVFARTGANSMTWEAPVTSVTYTTLTRATDSACAPTTLSTQAPNAGATGTNRTPGTLNLVVPAAVGGAAEGKIQLGLGGTTGVKFSKALVLANTFDMQWDSDALVSMLTAPAATSGYDLTIVAGAAGATGARSAGGDLSIGAGTAGGNSGAGAPGGSVTITSGVGSDNDGPGGPMDIITGNGGSATNNTAGKLRIGTGIPTGTGNKGTMEFYQGGFSGGKSVLVAYFDGIGRFHVGADADTTLTNLRINGATQATVGALGAAAAVPALPTGYLPIDIKGTEFVFPYYAKA